MSSEEKARFSGRDVAEALAAARRHFGVSRQQLRYEVIERKAMGPMEEAPTEDLIELEAWPVTGAEAERLNSDVSVHDGFARDRGPREHDRGGDRGRGDGRRGGGRGRGDRSPDEGRRDRGRGGAYEAERGAVDDTPFEMPALFPPPGVTSSEDVLRTLTTALLDGLDLHLNVARVSQNEIGVRVHLTGEDVGELLDADAEGLDALQYIANRLVQKDGRLEARVSYDADDYRAKHEQKLVELARTLAREVLETGETRKMPGMGPYERRLVHVALTEVQGVRTFSAGSGYARRLHIAPAREDGSEEDDDQGSGGDDGSLG